MKAHDPRHEQIATLVFIAIITVWALGVVIQILEYFQLW